VTKWDDRVRNHPVHSAFDKALDALGGLTRERVDLAPEDIDRLTWVVNDVRARLDHTPVMAVPAQTLDQLNTQATQIVGEVTNFVGNGNVNHLNNAIASADAMLEQARVLRHLSGDPAAEEAESYARRVEGLVATVVSAAEGDIGQLQESAEAARQQIESARDELTAELASTKQKAAESGASVEQQVTRLEQALATHQTQFDQAEKARIDAFEAAQRQVTEAVDATSREARERFSETADELKGDASGTLTALAELKQQADDLLGAIGVAGVASGYNETAKKEKKVANTWRLATVGVAVLAVAVLFSALFVDQSDAGSWRRLITRLVLSLSFAGLAAYCGRQSAEHRDVERDARRRQLQLAALNPYLANMPADQSTQLKGELAPGYFTPAVAAQNGHEAERAGPIPSAQLAEVITALVTKGAGR
jgi:hypothetical protein